MRSITTIIPVYNHRRWLRAAVLSALKDPILGYRSQVLVIDDGSTDGSIETIGDLPVTIKTLPNNLGFAGARNAGLEWVDCDWIAFLDADDLRVSGSVQKQLRWLENHPQEQAVFGTVQVSFIKDNGTVREMPYLNRCFPQGPRLIRASELKGGNDLVFSLAQGIYSRELFAQVGHFTGSSRHEDRDFFHRLLKHRSVWMLPQPMFLFQLHDKNIWNYIRLPQFRRITAQRWLLDQTYR